MWRSTHLLLPFVFLLAVVVSSCDDDPTAPGDPLASVEVTGPGGPLLVGDTVRLTAVARTATGAPLGGRTFTWSSRAPALATVDSSGLVTALAAGHAWITAAAGGRADSLEVVMQAPGADGPRIDSVAPSQIQAGWSSFALTVHGDGFTDGARIVWNETPLETVRLDGDKLQGTVPSALVASPGTATLRVTAGSALTSNPTPFVVHPRPALSVRIHLAGNAVFVGHGLTLDATAVDQHGQPIEDKPMEWTSSDTTVARIVGNRLEGRRPGTVHLEARATPAVARVPVRVLDAPALDLLVEAAPLGIPELFVYRLGPEPALSRIMAPGSYGWHASPSPDGSRIAFVAPSPAGDPDIWVVNRDGTGLRRITHDPALDDQPAWSPDGGSIAFISTRDGKPDLWVMDPEGGGPRNLTFASAWIPEELSTWPAWSPDGSALVFGRSFGTGQFLQTVNADGSGMRELRTQAGADLTESAWSPWSPTVAVRQRTIATGATSIELLAAPSGDPIPTLATWPTSPRAPSWLTADWMAVVGATETKGRAVHLVQLGTGVQVVPIPVELTSHNRAVLLPG